MFPPGFEPGTFRVWGERDNHYTTETVMYKRGGVSTQIHNTMMKKDSTTSKMMLWK